MHGIYELRDKLCKELDGYGTKELSAGSLSTIDTLAHAVKNLDKILEGEEYSNRGSYDWGRMYRDGSYARRRDGMGRYSRNYSRDGDMVERLRDLMNDAPDDRTRQEIQRLVTKMEQM